MVAARPGTPAGRAAFLRIYEPLDALVDMPAAHRARWRALAIADRGADQISDADRPRGGQRTTHRLDLARRERAAALRAASALPPRLVSDRDMIGPGDDQLAGELLRPAADDGIPRVCPTDLGPRVLLAISRLRRSVSPELLSAVFPGAELPGAELPSSARAAQDQPSGVPHVRSSNWYIPLCWFAAFRPEQQVARSGRGECDENGTDDGRPAASSEQEPGLPRPSDPLRYLASMADARRGVARALAAARRAPTDVMPAADLEELGRWLEEFHARSVVELDYGGLVGLAGRPEFGEACVESVVTAIANIRSGDAERVPVGIEQLAEVQRRWAAARLVGRAS